MKVSDIKFQGNPFSGSHDDTDGQTGRHTERRTDRTKVKGAFREMPARLKYVLMRFVVCLSVCLSVLHIDEHTMCCKRVQQKIVRCPQEKVSVVECECISVRLDISTTCMNMAVNGDTNKINDKTFD